jgi:hypothetical protein
LPDAPEITTDRYQWGGRYFVHGPRLLEFLQEMKQNALSPYDTLTVGASSAPIGEPGRCLPRNPGWNYVAAFELAVAYLVSSSFELGDDPATAGVDREPPVLGSVRDKDTR